MAEIATREVLLDREGRGQEVELVEAAAGRADVRRDLVAVPELGLEIGDPLVVDDEPRGCERLETLVDLLRVVGDVVGAALHRREPDALPGDAQEDDVGERADEHRVALLERVLGRIGKLVERRRVRSAGGAPESLRIGRVEHVEDEVGLGDIVDPDEVVFLELLADRRDPLLDEPGRSRFPRSRTCARIESSRPASERDRARGA